MRAFGQTDLGRPATWIARAKAANFVLKTSERTARTTLRDLVKQGFLNSGSPKAPVRIAFPLDYRERLFPNLFTDAEVNVPEPRVPIPR